MFRNAEEKDFALYMELAQEFYHSPAVMHPIPAQYMENTFREAMRSDVYIILRILEVDGEAAGYAILSRSFSPASSSLHFEPRAAKWEIRSAPTREK